MLSRAADSLFWMGRYMERADATSRLIEMGRRMTMVPGTSEHEEWRSVAAASGAAPDLAAAASPTAEEVIDRLLLDAGNPSSIRSCFAQARANGRAIRTALTQDMWETLNDDWRQLGDIDAPTARQNLSHLLEWTKTRTAAFRGATESSLLRTDGYFFLRLGGSIERSIMTLRLLDVKYFVLLPETDVVGGGRDFHQWTSVLRATSALRAYHHVNRGGYTPWGIAEFLILNPVFPRSVAFSLQGAKTFIDQLATLYGERKACHDTADRITSRLRSVRIEDVFRHGLHEFVAEIVRDAHQLSRDIHDAYYF